MSKGVYCLVVYLSRNRKINIGSLGFLNFKKGYYCYVGSALNNLEKRIERHKRKNKTFHWHIDYLLSYGKIVEVLKIITNKKIECKLSKAIAEKTRHSVSKFGCSDCKCHSHLYFFKKNPFKSLVQLKKTFIKTRII